MGISPTFRDIRLQNEGVSWTVFSLFLGFTYVDSTVYKTFFHWCEAREFKTYNFFLLQVNLFVHLDVRTGSGKDGRRFRLVVGRLVEGEQLVQVVGLEEPVEERSG